MKIELLSSLLLLPELSFPASFCPALSLVFIRVPINLDLSRVLLSKACIGLTQGLQIGVPIDLLLLIR